MTCANWLLTILAVVILVFTFWATSISQWLVAIAAVLVLIIAWTGVEGKPCADSKPMAVKPVAKPAKKKKKK